MHDPNPLCQESWCWVEEAHVTELTGILRPGREYDQLTSWPQTMRIFARRERPHPGAQLSLFEAAAGYRYVLRVTNLPASTRGWRANPSYIDAGHRVHARVEDGILLSGAKSERIGYRHGSGRSATEQNRAVTPQVLREASCPVTASVRAAATRSTTPLEVCCEAVRRPLWSNVMRQAEDPLEKHRNRQGHRVRPLPLPQLRGNSAWLSASLIAATLLAWLKLIALDGALARSRAQDLAIQDLARRRPPGPQRLPPDPQDRRHLALGRHHHRSVAASRRARPRAITDRPCPAPPTSQTQAPWKPPDTRPASRATIMPMPSDEDHLRSQRGHHAPAITPHE